jgi:RNA polymerase sigma factor (sigma-70 family)
MSNFNVVSEETITMAMQGDEEAFTQIYKTYYKRVYFMGLQFFKNEDTAKEVVQEVFIKVYKQIATLKAPKTFGRWLYVVTYRMCQDLSRKRTNMKTIELREDEKIEDFADGESTDVSSIVANTRMKETIINSLKAMSESLRIVGVLRYLEDMKVQEIADVLGISKNTVGTRLIKIRKVLQKDLTNEGFSINQDHATVIITPLLIQEAYTMMFNSSVLQEEIGLSLLDNVLKTKLGMKVGKQSNKWLLSMGIGVSAIMIYSGYKMIETPTPIEVEEIHYSKEVTNKDVSIEVVLNTTPKNQVFTIYYEDHLVPYTIKDNQIYFNATNNGIYRMETKDIKKTITIDNIDRTSPEIGEVHYDGSLLTYQINPLETIDYDTSYIEYQGERIAIDDTHQISGLFSDMITFTLYDIAGNYSTYTITINDITTEVLS